MSEMLITGIGGFTGPHVAQAALEGGYIVSGAISPHSGTRRLETVLDPRGIALHEVNLTDLAETIAVLDATRPEVIIHLANRTSGRLLTGRGETLNNNVATTANLIVASRLYGYHPKVVFASSSSVYGPLNSTSPIDETAPLNPNSEYGLSKAQQEGDLQQARQEFGLKVVFARPSQHIGPGQEGNFAAPEIAHQIIEIEDGLASVVWLRNLEAEVAGVDVRDIAHAYLLLADLGVDGEIVNISSDPLTLRQMTLLMLRHSSVIDLDRIAVRSKEPERPVLARYDWSKIKSAYGWEPRISPEQSLADSLQWIKQHAAKTALLQTLSSKIAF